MLGKLENIIVTLDFFSSLDSVFIKSIASMSYIKNYSSGTILTYESSDSNKLIFLVDGLAKAYKVDKYENEVFLYSIYKNSMISEISSLDSNKLISFSNIIIERDSTILVIDYLKFKKSFLDSGLLTLKMAKEVVRQSRQLQNIVNREFVFDSIAKVAMMLYEDLAMFNHTKRSEVSLMLHIQPATLSRVLKRLKRDNIISIDKGIVSVVDRDSLLAISCV